MKCWQKIEIFQYRRELYHVGVTSSTIQPGPFKTSIVDPNEMKSTLQRAFDSVDEEVQQFYGQNWLNKSKFKVIKLLLIIIGISMTWKSENVTFCFSKRVFLRNTRNSIRRPFPCDKRHVPRTIFCDAKEAIQVWFGL